MIENEFLLQDRLQKIRSIIEQYGEENFYISFSGGKDSTVLSALVDMAIPNNTIPRVYANTGIEYRLIVDFVEKERAREHPWELIILKPEKNIKQMLEEEGYPFKSKTHAKYVYTFQKLGYSKGVTQYLGERTDKPQWSSINTCPKKLRYQFNDDFTMKISDHCCLRLKEDVMERYGKSSNRKIAITGIMGDEGGRRKNATCLAFQGKKLKRFQPLMPVTKEFIDWVIEEYKINICDLYKAPYHFERTGCKGCPFARHLQRELDTLEKFFPDERRQCELIWKPVYEEYRRIGYRLKQSNNQINITEYLSKYK